MCKRLKASKRGLTFSVNENSVFPIGGRYRYLVDKKKREIIIFPSDENGNTVSRKCYGRSKVLPLIDIRSKEIRDMVSNADYLEVETLTDSLIVRAYKDSTEEVELEEDVPIIEFEVPNNDVNLSQYDFVIGELLRDQGIRISEEPIREDLSRVFSVISLFSGCGGLDLSFQKDNCFKIVFANELNQAAAASYRENLGLDVCCKDIRRLLDEEIPQADVVIGGVPCTPYASTNRSSKRLSVHPDSDLINYFLNTVKKSNAHIFAIENVSTFISEKTGCINKIRSILPNYNISYRVVCDSNLGGFTERRRLVLLGSRDCVIEIPDIEVFPKRTVRQALCKVNESWPNYYDVTKPSDDTRLRMSYVPQGGNYKNMPGFLQNGSIHSNIFRRLHPDRPSVALPNWRKTNTLHYMYDRILTVSEASALSGYDKNFRFSGNLSEKQQQCGNVVPRSISTYIKLLIKDALIKLSKGNIFRRYLHD